jgi:hypothetical protein
MNAKVSPSRRKVISLAEEHLRRPLTTKEHEIVRRWAEGVVEILGEDSSGKEIVEMIDEANREDNPVRLFDELAASSDPLSQDHAKLLAFHEGNAKNSLEAFDIDLALEKFTAWFLRVLRADPPSSGVQALRFGLFEADGACRLYVSGSKTYDQDVPDWALSSDWWREDHVMSEVLVPALWSQLKRTGAEPWVAAQAIVIILVRVFFANHAKEFQGLSGLRRVHVVAGFDEGDQYAIRTPLAPRA